MIHAGWGAVLLAFVGGLVSFFSPCVAPLVPGYIGYLSGAALRTEEGAVGATATVAVGKPARLPGTARVTVLFVAGFSLAFVLLGLLTGGFGSVLRAYQPVMETVAGIVMVVMGAFLLGLLPKPLTGWLLREGRMQLAAPRASMLGSAAPVALGVVFAAGWSPCIGPVLATILAVAGASGSSGAGALLLAVYSLGFALPFLAIGLGWSVGLRALGWAKRHGERISMVSGAVLVLVGIVYLTGEVTVFSAWAQRFVLPGM